VTVIMALLGISFLLMAETENRIARNERRAAQAYYVAESTVRVVKGWFDSPVGALSVPAVGTVDRTQRAILDETDPYDPADVTPSDGVVGSAPYYKQGIDLNGNGVDDLFDRPYRGTVEDAFMGTESGPDIVLDNSDADAATFFRALEAQLFPGYPGDGIEARISRIDIFAPPYVRTGATWSRFGLATVRVSSQLVIVESLRVIAEREVSAVLSPIPYWGVYGPLHSCADLTFTGSSPSLHWGAVTAEQQMRLAANLADLPDSLPRQIPAVPRADSLLSSIDWTDWAAEVSGSAVKDPWLRFLAGGDITAPPVPNGGQPYPSPWNGWSAGDPPPGGCCDTYSHLFQQQPLVGCPSYEYDDWKAIASTGERGVHYMVPAGGGLFSEDGLGTPGTLQSLTNGREGIYFFDSADGLAPHDDDGDGDFDNLTSAVTIAGNWSFSGVIFLNAESFRLNGATGVARSVRAPGEPFLDVDGNTLFDAGEPYLNLSYPASAGTLFNAASIAATGVRDSRGPSVSIPVSMDGMLINQGRFEATGTGTIYGSVVALGGVTQAVADGSAPTPRILFDTTFLEGYPAVGSALPRVTITGWVTEP
jgi:hypothetical protein